MSLPLNLAWLGFLSISSTYPLHTLFLLSLLPLATLLSVVHFLPPCPVYPIVLIVSCVFLPPYSSSPSFPPVPVVYPHPAYPILVSVTLASSSQLSAPRSPSRLSLCRANSAMGLGWSVGGACNPCVCVLVSRRYHVASARHRLSFFPTRQHNTGSDTGHQISSQQQLKVSHAGRSKTSAPERLEF